VVFMIGLVPWPPGSHERHFRCWNRGAAASADEEFQ
jgi:hypothetical protein